MMVTPLPANAIRLDQACILSLVNEPRRIKLLLWLVSLTLVVVLLQSVYLFVFVSKPIATLEGKVARHSTQIDAIISQAKFSESMQSKIMEKLNGR